MKDIYLEKTVRVNGCKLVKQETFRAVGVLWVRYVREGSVESLYATSREWLEWENSR